MTDNIASILENLTCSTYKLVDKSYFEILKLIHIEIQINYFLKRFLQNFKICKVGYFRRELAWKTERF